MNHENINKNNGEIAKNAGAKICVPVAPLREHAGARPLGFNLSSRVEDNSPPSPPQASSDCVDVDDLVHVNCKTISGPGFVLDLKAVEYDASLYGVSSADAKKIAEAQARHWAANKQIPPNPGGMLKGVFAGHRTRNLTYTGKVQQIARQQPNAAENDLLRRPPDTPESIWQNRLKQLVSDGRATRDQALAAGWRPC